MDPHLSDSHQAEELHIADYVRPMWQRKWLILVAVVLATTGVYAYYANKPDVYRASTLVYTKDPGDPVTGAASQAGSDRSVQNQAALLYSRDVARSVNRAINFPGSPEALLNAVKIEARAGEDFVVITARAPSGQLAADIVNGYAREFASVSNEQNLRRIRKARGVAQQQLDSLPNTEENQITREGLASEVRRLDLALAVPPATTQQVDRALPPSEPVEPKPVRNAGFAFVLSLILAITLAFGMERFDRRIKRPEDVEVAYRLPLLAVLPHSNEPDTKADDLISLSPVFREAFRALRSNIELATLDAPARTILVTSAGPSEGKSTVARNLALVFRETGKRVAVVEADLRRPSLANLFGQEAREGLTEVLTGDAPLASVTNHVPVQVPGLETLNRLSSAEENESNNGNSANGGDNPAKGTISLILSGARPANPPAVLAANRVHEVLDEIAAQHDVVIIDSAPLLAVTDTVPLLRYADSVLLVGRTTRDTARRVVEFVSRVPDVPILGVVANDLSNLEATGYGYGGYGYGGYGYGYGDDEGKSSKSRSKSAV
jgi:Mrp family chromosome partitioning ATPase/capsular polysaccharide biosynthesis protein